MDRLQLLPVTGLDGKECKVEVTVADTAAKLTAQAAPDAERALVLMDGIDGIEHLPAATRLSTLPAGATLRCASSFVTVHIASEPYALHIAP